MMEQPCYDYTCPYMNSRGYCSLTACVKPQIYFTNRTETMEPKVKVCPHCGNIIEHWYEEV